MGQQYSAKCQDCDHLFKVSEGGGFMFDLLHCDQCGEGQGISYDEMGEPLALYLKNFDSGFMHPAEQKQRDEYAGDPISRERFQEAVEASMTPCECGGRFKYDAPPRCPKCRSTHLVNTGEGLLMYD